MNVNVRDNRHLAPPCGQFMHVLKTLFNKLHKVMATVVVYNFHTVKCVFELLCLQN